MRTWLQTDGREGTCGTNHPHRFTETPQPRLEGTFVLSHGRSIGFAEYGSAGGTPIFWFPGTPGGRRQIPPLARTVATERGIRLIALERPGLGSSTPHLYESVLGWADDVEEIADRLRLGRFGLVGLSGGGPYVLACAYRIPARVVAAAVLGGVAPSCGDGAHPGGAVGRAARYHRILRTFHEPLALAAWATVYSLRPLASQVFDLFATTMPEGDQEVFGRPEMKEMFIDDMLRASRRQLRAPLYDAVLFTKPWGFSLRDIRVPIRLWHGDADTFVPLDHARHLAALIPDAELTIRPREGHMGNLDAAEEIIDTLLALWPGQGAPSHLSSRI
jgi:pimeloyl-ACP methyl ester carboxylesterase